jgi:enterochelin esterase-like enzyme
LDEAVAEARSLASALAASRPLRAGEVNVLGPVETPGLLPRRVRIYLPRSGAAPGASPPVLVLFDGQNVFDDGPSFAGGWRAHEAAERLGRRGCQVPVIVGVDHGGEERIRELSPFAIEGEPGRLAVLADWMAGTLMPVFAAELALASGPGGVVIGGSSLGGLAALWSHFHHPRTFGGALAMSPSLWLAERAIFADLEEQPDPEPSRIYLDMGGREDRGRQLPIAASLAARLAARGWDRDRLLWRPDVWGRHNEASWRRRLPKALRFLFGPRSPV